MTAAHYRVVSDFVKELWPLKRGCIIFNCMGKQSLCAGRNSVNFDVSDIHMWLECRRLICWIAKFDSLKIP